MNADQFADRVLNLARVQGFPIKTNRNGVEQIDFGHKKLHRVHLCGLYPDVLEDGVHIGRLIDRVALGRPCTHKPMRELVSQLKVQLASDA